MKKWREVELVYLTIVVEYNNQIEQLKSMLEQSLSKEEILSRMTGEIKSLQTDLPCGVNFIITNEKNELLLMKRKATVGNGTWGLCGGHLKEEDTLEETAVRECFEELGIRINIEDVEVISLADTNRNKRYFQVEVLIKKYSGIPKIMEPHKASEIMWVSEEDLPNNLFFGTEPQIRLFFKNKFYDKNENIYLNKKEK